MDKNDIERLYERYIGYLPEYKEVINGLIFGETLVDFVPTFDEFKSLLFLDQVSDHFYEHLNIVLNLLYHCDDNLKDLFERRKDRSRQIRLATWFTGCDFDD